MTQVLEALVMRIDDMAIRAEGINDDYTSVQLGLRPEEVNMLNDVARKYVREIPDSEISI